MNKVLHTMDETCNKVKHVITSVPIFPDVFSLLQAAHGGIPGRLPGSGGGAQKRGEVAKRPAHAGPGGPVQRGCQGKITAQ